MKQVAKYGLPLLVILGAVLIGRGLLALKPEAKRKVKPARIPAVDVMTVAVVPGPTIVEATGIVEPARRVVITPEVTGKIVWQSSALVEGGRFKRGAILARIDARDYQARLAQQQAQVEQAAVDVQLEESRGHVAKREWKMLGKQRESASAPGLALRKPQLAAAQARLMSAQAGVERAALMLDNTKLVAPFNALVLQEDVELGQVVSPQTKVATLIGTDRFFVKLQVPVDKLAALRFEDSPRGSKAIVSQPLADGRKLTREGRVIRLLGQLDPATRTAQVVVAIDRPLDVLVEGLPLLPGAFVEARLEGAEQAALTRVPRQALFDGEMVWVVDEDRLRRRQVEIAWRGPSDVAVRSGLKPGERVVTSALSSPIDGMRVQVIEENRPDTPPTPGPDDAPPKTSVPGAP